MRYLLAVAVVGAMLAGSSAARAMCGPPDAGIQPRHGDFVPRNTQIRVVGFSGYRIDAVSIRRVYDGEFAGDAIAVRRDDYPGVEVLTPELPLEPWALYEVVVDGDPHRVDGHYFVATASIDHTAPSWFGVDAVRGELRWRPETSRWWVYMNRPGHAFDAYSRRDDIVYGVWPGDVDFDPTRKPEAIPREVFRDFNSRYGAISNERHPCGCDPVRWRPIEALAWVAPIDLAGNVGTPELVDLDLNGWTSHTPHYRAWRGSPEDDWFGRELEPAKTRLDRWLAWLERRNRMIWIGSIIAAALLALGWPRLRAFTRLTCAGALIMTTLTTTPPPSRTGYGPGEPHIPRGVELPALQELPAIERAAHRSATRDGAQRRAVLFAVALFVAGSRRWLVSRLRSSVPG